MDVGLSNILDREGREPLPGRQPSKRTHGAGVASTLVGSELPTKVGEGIETADSVEAFLVLAVTSFYLAIVARCVRADQLVTNAKLCRGCLEQRRHVPPAAGEAIRELKAVVCLYALNFHAFAGK